jgi:hypothetical protein
MSYDEQTYTRPDGSKHGPACEVYGATGYGFYTYKNDAAESFPRTNTTPTGNPLFVNLEGMTTQKLTKGGFMR